MEDVDGPRCAPGTDQIILTQLAALGLVPDETPLYQSRRSPLYQAALDRLAESGLVYPCRCSRKDIETALAASGSARPRGGELVYPGTCRASVNGRSGTAWRLHTGRAATGPVEWRDRRLGTVTQDVEKTVGDFPLKRADGCFTYQLAVVVDDAAQGITQVVRGEDLADNTARQILLQRALQLPEPAYLHTPLVLGANGEKLSKQNGAQALDITQPKGTLAAAAGVLGLHAAGDTHSSQADLLAFWVRQWRELYNLPRD